MPHQTVDVQSLDVDFLAFSLHKMCGPRGVGVLYGKKEQLGRQPHEEDEAEQVLAPVIQGEGTVADSTYRDYTLMLPPDRFEAGILDYPAQIASGAAVQYLQQIGLDRIRDHQTSLNHFLTGELLHRYGDTGWFSIFGPQDATQRGGILTFEVKRPNAIGLASDLSEKNIVMIRDGVFCVHAYLTRGLDRHGPAL